MLKNLLVKSDELVDTRVQNWLKNFDFDRHATVIQRNQSIKREIVDHDNGSSKRPRMTTSSPLPPELAAHRVSPTHSCDSTINSPSSSSTYKSEKVTGDYHEYSLNMLNYYIQRQQLDIQKGNELEQNKHLVNKVTTEIHPERPLSTFSNDSGILVTNNGTISPQIQEFNLKPMDLLELKPEDEFYRIQKLSKKRRQEYIEKQRKDNPIDFSYNPNKSRNLKKYADTTQAEERARNNFASRRSRYKKKLEAQTNSFSLEFNMMECRALWEEEKAITEAIQYMEEVCGRAGVDRVALLEMRQKFGLQ